MHQSFIAKPLYRQIVTPFALLMVACFFSALILFTSWLLGWKLWIIGLLIIVAWIPPIIARMREIYLQRPWLAFLFLLVAGQFGHMLEHCAQMVQIHILGLHGAQASGIIGALNIEWVHLIWSSWVLLGVALLLLPRSPFHNDMWLWMLFIFAIYHEAEHIYIVSVYIKTGIIGTPGLLAKGGLIGVLPIVRPDLHFLYAVLEEAMLLVVYLMAVRKTSVSSLAQQIA